MDTHQRLLAALAWEALSAPDAPVTSTALGGCLSAVRAARTGLASLPHGTNLLAAKDPDELPATVHGLVKLLAGPCLPTTASLAVAAMNTLLPPPDNARNAKGQDVVLEHGRDRRVAVVGHFPFVERLAEHFESFDVLELRPRPGDLPAEAAADVLPRADVAVLTGSSLVNGTLGGLLDMVSPDTFVMVLGPSTPFARCLFQFGVDVVAGAEVTDPDAAMDGVAKGLAFRQLRGVRSLAWFRDEA